MPPFGSPGRLGKGASLRARPPNKRLLLRYSPDVEDRRQVARIVITRDTRYPWLREQVAHHSDEIAMITGIGARAVRLEERLHREFQNVSRPWSVDGREWVTFIDDGSMRVIAWGHDDPGKPPVVEVEGPDGVVR